MKGERNWIPFLKGREEGSFCQWIKNHREKGSFFQFAGISFFHLNSL
uniref:Uncharacterized protein n=1 Tax=Setaria viridis TaxID=4556 RepID=A0A4U6VFR8_SETVI|nr:hypothetical protein SEVIR_3G268350v2 [Setaria viridis]